MLKKIESIRQKPITVRNKYAFWYAFGFTSIIAVFWLINVPSRLGLLTTESQDTVEIQGGLSRSFSDLRASISGGVETLNQLKENTSVHDDVSIQNEDTIDFDTYFSTSSTDTTVVSARPKQVLIGTTSSANIDSIEE